MKKAVVKVLGKQYIVTTGEKFKVDKMEGVAGNPVEIKEVLFLDDNGKLHIGSPTVKGAKVSCEFVSSDKQDKVYGVKFKRRKRYCRRIGHRQILTTLLVKDISLA